MRNNLEVVRDIINNFNENLEIDIVKTKPDEYYELVSKYGITDKLNNIIDNFQNKIKHTNYNSSIFEKFDLNIGIICDEFLYYSLKDSANFHYVPYSEDLKIDKTFDIFLVVTSWRGLDNSWDYIANPKGEKRKKLIELIRKYNNSDIPTIFYSKEDPISYNEYISLAKECQFIFTSAQEMINKYKRDTGNLNVEYLEFGINVSYHNPIGKDLKDDLLSKQLTFAGSWMKRFPERNSIALKLFEGVSKTDYELSIIDRQYERRMERYHYPPHLLRNVSATIPHSRLMSLHKATQWGINLNSVQDSMTMFANRVYELQGMGNIVLSNYNQGVHNKFPNVKMVYLKEDLQENLNNISFDEKKNLIATGIRNVMFNHTAFHRVSKIVSKLGFDYELFEPNILVIGEGELSKKSFERQRYKNKTYINSLDFDNNKIDVNDFDYIAEFNDSNIYEEYYLDNLLSAFVYTDADIIQMNKNVYNYVTGNDYKFTFSLYKANIYKSQTDTIVFNIPETEFIKLDDSTKNKSSSGSLLTVIIPIDNSNITKIEYKALYSLNQLHNLSSINIILINFEVLNEENDMILNRILRKYKNVKLFSKKDKDGLNNKIDNLFKNINTELLSFLSAENELLINEYNNLINIMSSDEQHDITLGKSINYEGSTELFSSLDDIVMSKTLSSSNYLESIIFRTKYLQEKVIDMNMNKLESDSFLYNLIDENIKYKSVNKIIHKSNKYKNKTNDNNMLLDSLYDSLETEKSKLKLISSLEQVKTYTENVFPEIFMNKYLLKFKNLKREEKIKGLEILGDIVNLYIIHYDYTNLKFNQVLELLFDYTE